MTTTYGADLEAFVEKRFGEQLRVRLTGTNLLDASKDEEFHKFDTLADQIDRDYDEYELESETSGPVLPAGRALRVLIPGGRRPPIVPAAVRVMRSAAGYGGDSRRATLVPAAVRQRAPRRQKLK